MFNFNKHKYKLYGGSRFSFYLDHNSRQILLFDISARILISVGLILIGVVLLLNSPGATTKQSTSKKKSLVVSAVPYVVNSPEAESGKVLGLAMGNTLPNLSQTQLDNELNGVAKLGVGWIRIDMDWASVQPDNANSYNWTTLDNIVAAANSRHIKILAILDYTPSWARAAGCSGGESCAPASDSQFADYVTAVVKRYSPDGLQTWEIWNEPNLAGSWQPSPNAESYTQLLEASYKAIKKVEPLSTVISGGLGPLDGQAASIDQLTFLSQMYSDGAEPYFDALGYHPYSYPALPSYVISWNSWSTMNDLPTSARSIMTANGDVNKQLWVTEYGAPTGGPGAEATTTDPNFNAGPDHVDDALQAEMLSEALSDYQSYSWMGGFFWYSYQDLGTSTSSNENFFGLLTYSGAEKLSYNTMLSATSNPQL